MPAGQGVPTSGLVPAALIRAVGMTAVIGTAAVAGTSDGLTDPACQPITARGDRR